MATVVVVVVAAATLATAATATAGKRAPGSISIYASKAVGPADSISFGQLSSKKPACVAHRKFKAIVSVDGKRTVIESGRTSNEGGVSTLLSVSDFPNDRGDPFIFIAKTKKCAKVIGPLIPTVRTTSGPRRATSSLITVLGIFAGSGNDAVVGGWVDSDNAVCRRDRKLELTIGSKTIDRGTSTSTDGTFALHIRLGEMDTTQIAVLAPGTKKCAATVTTFSPSG